MSRNLSTRHQLFGDVNEELNTIRNRFNQGIRKKVKEELDKKREGRGNNKIRV